MRTLLIAFVLFAVACSGDNPGSPEVMEGTFTLLTYNVAGLPQGVSPSNPEKNIPIMSPLLNRYDIVLVQEDFFYHDELVGQANHSNKSSPKATRDNFTTGDGLNRFSRFPFSGHARRVWIACSSEAGNDCLAQKGFSFARTELAPGLEVDIYNVHHDAGGTEQDIEARRQQIEQLLTEITTRSQNRAIIVGGDLNLDVAARPADVTLFRRLTDGVGLNDACREASCNLELVDRVLFRDSSDLNLQLLTWETDDAFVDENGARLSDHLAVAVTFKWSTQ